mmetsp:Transcript_35704/g.57526  ORF Transcript_35704/g.57526 Transcript_35704/m.57526 type:complete len:200 (+) Transcript_35704:1210-1809(+)
MKTSDLVKKQGSASLTRLNDFEEACLNGCPRLSSFQLAANVHVSFWNQQNTDMAVAFPKKRYRERGIVVLCSHSLQDSIPNRLHAFRCWQILRLQAVPANISHAIEVNVQVLPRMDWRHFCKHLEKHGIAPLVRDDISFLQKLLQCIVGPGRIDWQECIGECRHELFGFVVDANRLERQSIISVHVPKLCVECPTHGHL